MTCNSCILFLVLAFSNTFSFVIFMLLFIMFIQIYIHCSITKLPDKFFHECFAFFGNMAEARFL